MEVSTFELLIKPIAPRMGLPANVQSGLRRVVQGYFLTISNLENQDLRFRIEFFDSTPSPANTDRQLSTNPRNFDVFYDIAGANVTLPTFRTGSLVRTVFTLPARQTASVQLLPSLTPFINNPDPDLEIRGFVKLDLPANIRIERDPFQVIREPQREEPAKVLLQPELRGTFLPNNFPNQATGDFDQISSSLITATGAALNEIEPEGPFIFDSDLITSTLQRVEAEGFDLSRLEGLSEIEQATMLVESIAQLNPTPENLEQVSDLLSKLDIPIRMSAV